MKSHTIIKWIVLTVTIPMIILGCTSQSTETTTTPITYSLPQLEYRLLAYFDDVFWCNLHLYPIPRPEQEQTDALEQYPAIKANEDEFIAILDYLSMSNKGEYTDEEKLLIYRQHKKLTYAVQITLSEDIYQFIIRVGEGQGETLEGEVTKLGEIKVLKREPSINSCPICLTSGTLIDTPNGMVPVELISEGMTVWTLDASGNRISSTVTRTIESHVPASFQVVKLELADGRFITASPGHPSADGIMLSEYKLNNRLDGSTIVAINYNKYEGMTYDILPKGTTGNYWANGILLQSTLISD